MCLLFIQISKKKTTHFQIRWVFMIQMFIYLPQLETMFHRSHVRCVFCEFHSKLHLYLLLSRPPPLCLHYRCGNGWAFVMHLCHPVMRSAGSPSKTAHMAVGFANHTRAPAHTQALVHRPAHTLWRQRGCRLCRKYAHFFFFPDWNMMQTSPHLLWHAHTVKHT